VPELSSLVERIKVNLRHIAAFYYEEASRIAAWWLWNVPFQLLQILFSLLLFKYYALAFGGSSPLYGGDFMAFIIAGLAINTYMDASLEVYYSSIAALYYGRMGIGGVHLSRRDYLHLAGVSPLAFIFARVSWRYLMETLIFALYIAAGALFFGFRVSAGANLGLVLCIILLSIAACSAVGLISASMYWLAGAYRGVEPRRLAREAASPPRCWHLRAVGGPAEGAGDAREPAASNVRRERSEEGSALKALRSATSRASCSR
jgi:hypothetical protein